MDEDVRRLPTKERVALAKAEIKKILENYHLKLWVSFIDPEDCDNVVIGSGENPNDLYKEYFND